MGNSPDPLDLIAQYGADALRMGMMLCSAAGNDLIFDETLIEQGRNFCGKMWNAFRLVKGWSVADDVPQPDSSACAVEWFSSKLDATLLQVEAAFAEYRISEALMMVYKLFWDEFSGWYLEMVKPAYGEPIDGTTLNATIGFFDKLLKVLHPFMPFITEELWHYIAERKDGDSIMIERLPEAGIVDENIISDMELVKEIVSSVCNIRKEKGLPLREKLELIAPGGRAVPERYDSIIIKMAALDKITGEAKPEGAVSFIVKGYEYFIPVAGAIDTDAEIAKLTADLEYARGFLANVMKKLSNERFVASAPEKVVALEHAKRADALKKIEALEQQIANLKK